MSTDRKAAPVGQDAGKAAADRARQIQELQRSAEPPMAPGVPAKPAGQPINLPPRATPAPPPAPVYRTDGPDRFALSPAREVAGALTPAGIVQQNAYAARQVSTDALFGASAVGGPSDVQVLGNPWKIIPFGDTLPGLFELKKAPGDYQPVVPERAVRTPHGVLFELGLREQAQNGAGPLQKRAVLVDDRGGLVGAECKSVADVQQLYAKLPWLLPSQAVQRDTTWRIEQGKDSAYSMVVQRQTSIGPKVETLLLNNFGKVTNKLRAANLVVAQYHLDQYDAAAK